MVDARCNASEARWFCGAATSIAAAHSNSSWTRWIASRLGLRSSSSQIEFRAHRKFKGPFYTLDIDDFGLSAIASSKMEVSLGPAPRAITAVHRPARLASAPAKPPPA